MKKNERGSAAVEAAFVFPFVLLIILVIAEYGVYFLTSYRYQQAAFTGARAGAISQVNKTTVAQNAATNLLTQMGVSQENLPTITVNIIPDTPLPGKSLIEVRLARNPYVPVTGINRLGAMVGLTNIVPTSILVESSQVNY